MLERCLGIGVEDKNRMKNGELVSFSRSGIYLSMDFLSTFKLECLQEIRETVPGNDRKLATMYIQPNL